MGGEKCGSIVRVCYGVNANMEQTILLTVC